MPGVPTPLPSPYLFAAPLPTMDQCWVMLLQSIRSVIVHLKSSSLPPNVPVEAQYKAMQVQNPTTSSNPLLSARFLPVGRSALCTVPS